MLLTWALILAPIVLGLAAVGLNYLKAEFYSDPFYDYDEE